MTEQERAGRHVPGAWRSVRPANSIGLVKSVEYLLKSGGWREFVSRLDLRVHHYDSFAEFVQYELDTTGEALVMALSSTPNVAHMVLDELSLPVRRTVNGRGGRRHVQLGGVRTTACGLQIRRTRSYLRAPVTCPECVAEGSA